MKKKEISLEEAFHVTSWESGAKPKEGYVKHLDGPIYRSLISRYVTYNRLGQEYVKYDKVKNLNELESFSELDILMRHNFGRKRLAHVHLVMESYGLKLGSRKKAA